MKRLCLGAQVVPSGGTHSGSTLEHASFGTCHGRSEVRAVDGIFPLIFYEIIHELFSPSSIFDSGVEQRPGLA